ncbi:endonuclease III-like [Planoprotostelium fungivorum]|uniref:Endonuclease III-like n=1 Tax=Planoprotostelium fungivorum TaxID=1890364 RepID=A0A2P6NHQ5_9EUKA|nr:endonuclease III-like [Planoprotostelium fungivorum]
MKGSAPLGCWAFVFEIKSCFQECYYGFKKVVSTHVQGPIQIKFAVSTLISPFRVSSVFPLDICHEFVLDDEIDTSTSGTDLTSYFKRKEPIKVEYDCDDVPKKKVKVEEAPSKLSEVRASHEVLLEFFGQPKRRESGNSINCCGRKETILEACIALIIAQNTSGIKSEPAYASLRKTYPSLDDMRKSTPQEIQLAIKGCGLDRQKSEWIHNLLKQVHDEYGETSLESLREKKTEEAKKILSKYKGLGSKTISCVLLFTMGRPDMPVDTHVHRTAIRIGWAPQSNNREKTYKTLNEGVIPDDLKYDMHVLLFKLGQLVCQEKDPKCGSCPVSQHCGFKGKTDKKVSLSDVQRAALLNDE